jgi:hypothetical protein
MRLPILAPAVLVAVASLVGCATSVLGSGDQADAEASTVATAIVVVERTVSMSPGSVSPGTGGGAAETVRGEAVARVVRMRSGPVDEDALRLVGGAVDLPALGTCTALGASRDGSGSSSSGAASGSGSASPMRVMSLVDVGAVTLEAGGVKTSLAPRQLPDVADLVSGVVYTARPGDGAIPARGSFVVRAAGSADLDVAPFVVDAIAPGEPTDLRISGQDARSAAGVALVPNAAAEVTWAPGGTEDVVYVDILPSAVTMTVTANTLGASGAGPVRCVFADAAGRGALPASALAAFEDGTLSVHRLHRESFHAHGIEPGEVRFDFARAVAFSRR